MGKKNPFAHQWCDYWIYEWLREERGASSEGFNLGLWDRRGTSACLVLYRVTAALPRKKHKSGIMREKVS